MKSNKMQVCKNLLDGYMNGDTKLFKSSQKELEKSFEQGKSSEFDTLIMLMARGMTKKKAQEITNELFGRG